MIRRRFVFLLFGLFAFARVVSAGELILAGPMVGHVSDSTASVWLRAEDGSSISAQAHQGTDPAKAAKIENLGEGFYLARFEGLKPETPTEATIDLERERKVSDKVSFKTAPIPSATGMIKIAFGSCSKDAQFKRVPVFEAISDEKPDAAFFIGDNSYFIVGDQGSDTWGTTGSVGDWTSPQLMLARHMQTRTNPDLQRLIHTIPCYAVWDDHDYGSNDTDREFPLKKDSLRIFREIWANPSYGASEIPGIFSSFRFGPAEFFLMDDRYNKYTAAGSHPSVKPEEAVIWGDPQLQWLMTGLKASKAPVKFIVNGTQVLSQTKSGEGHFQEAKLEREKLFTFLKENKIGGVIFLTGDRHYSEVNRLGQQGGPDLLEFTSSPICQNEKVRPLEVKHPTQLWGVRGDSYGLATVEIEKEGKGMIRLETRDAQNHVPLVAGLRCVTNWELRKLNY